MTIPTTEQLARLACILSAGTEYCLVSNLVDSALEIWQEAEIKVARLHLAEREAAAAARLVPAQPPTQAKIDQIGVCNCTPNREGLT